VFREISAYVVADAYFSKKPFVDSVLEAELHFISRLRDDSVLMYPHFGKPTGKRGRPKKFAGIVNINNPDTSYFEKEVCNEELTIYSAVVYSKAFNREVKLAIAVFYKDGREVAPKLYFSTELLDFGRIAA